MLSITAIQESMLAVLKCSEGHLTADQVLALIKQEHPSASSSTVYRNLNIFADTGRIRRIHRADGPDYFERNLTPHDHAYCVNCGRVSDVVIPSLKDFLKENFNYPIVSFDLIVSYICSDCKAKEAAET